ncbi:MAG: hypothetical protein RBT59_07695 [Arcobacteraceae bacterium]|nr:hypothetical protein [Arcobacteraceae bacterium]
MPNERKVFFRALYHRAAIKYQKSEDYPSVSGGKKYSDAKMILNIRYAYALFIREDCRSRKLY